MFRSAFSADSVGLSFLLRLHFAAARSPVAMRQLQRPREETAVVSPASTNQTPGGAGDAFASSTAATGTRATCRINVSEQLPVDIYFFAAASPDTESLALRWFSSPPHALRLLPYSPCARATLTSSSFLGGPERELPATRAVNTWTESAHRWGKVTAAPSER